MIFFRGRRYWMTRALDAEAALLNIAGQETSRANATVKRMARIVWDYFNKLDGSEKWPVKL